MPLWSYPKVQFSDLHESYDYVIIGGGTAGCVLANRLSQQPSISVLVIERGDLKNGWISRVPLFSSNHASDGSRTAAWKSTPQHHVNGRELQLFGGRSVGGGSKINSMLYSRGIPAEYNSWTASGRQGWGYDEILPFFVKSENDLDRTSGFNDYHGSSGEWPNRSHKYAFWKHTSQIIQATTALGVPYVDDLNSPLHPAHGCAKLHFTIDSSGRRSSTLDAFLPPDLVRSRRDRLHVCTRTIVRRIEITNNTGTLSAEGVWVQSDGFPASSRFIRANKEVILSAGPISSPQILMLSGVGPEDHLREHNIPITKHLPGVGQNLQDHLSVPLQFQVPLEDSFVKVLVRPWTLVFHVLLYVLLGRGLLLAPVLELSIFLQSRLFNSKLHVATASKKDADAALPGNLPDIEIMPIAMGINTRGRGALSFFVVTLRPTSTGQVRLSSSDPLADPVIDPKYLSTDSDRSVMRQGIRFAMAIKDRLIAQKYAIVDSNVPKSNLDEDLDEFVRRECRSTFHYASTCRMAPEQDDTGIGGVVDDRLRVHGIVGLRIADSSIYPHILSTHLAAPTVAIAEKCAHMIKEDQNRKATNGV